MEKTKRLLIVVTQADWGGVQSMVFACAQEARRRGWEVLVAFGGEGLLQTRCVELNVPCRRLEKMHRSISPTHDIAGTRELVALMREWKPSVVFLHSSKAGVIGSIAARIAKVPRIVYRIGGWSFLDPVSPLQKTIRRWSEKLTGKLKDVIITVHPGDEMQASTHHIHAREQVVTIPNGLDLATFDAAQKSRNDARHTLASFFATPLPADAKILMSIANFYPAKDLPGYLQALALLVKRLPNVRAVLFGEGTDRAALEQLRTELGLTNIIALPGAHVGGNDDATLLSGADLFILSSNKEGMPWTVLEAMAARTPIVTTDVGSNRWALGDAAWIVPPRNPQALADAIADALQHPDEAARRATLARQTLESRFTAQSMWEKTFAVLDPSLPPAE